MAKKTITFPSVVAVVVAVALLAVVSNCAALNLRSPPGVVYAGVSKINGTLPLGTPLAGYNHGARAYKYWPLISPKEYTTWMEPSTGVMDPTWVKALVISDGTETICFATIDGIGADSSLAMMGWEIAQAQGFNVSFDNLMFSASHSHSGPGAISPEFLWSVAPATDLMVPSLQRQIATSLAQALVEAQNNMQPVQLGLGVGYLVGVTENRRAGISHYVNSGTIDPHLGVIRVDDLSGNPIATLWNFAMHGTCWGPDNMEFSGDIMGGSCEAIEQLVGGVALFVNADAGDIDPTGATCSGMPNYGGAPIIAQAVKETRDNITTSTSASIAVASKFVPFGPTQLNATLARFDNCTSGGYLDICTVCKYLRCDLNAHLPSSWVEDTPKFNAFRITIDEVDTVLVSMPGEALVELGWMIRNDTLDLGFEQTFLCGYTNSHMGYFATPNEYDIGGYESQLTLWGVDTALMVRAGCKSVTEELATL